MRYQKYQIKMMQRKYDYIIKVVLVGSTAVGKSALLKRFADDSFNQYYISTIGVDFRFKSLTIDDSYVKMQIWDTAGQQRFKGITKSYYNNVDAVILVYDIHDNKSFSEIQDIWLKQARMYCKNNIKIYAICNKCDQYTQCMKSSHKHFFDQEKIKCFETSAKTGKSVNQAFIKMGRELIKIVPKVQEKMLSYSLKNQHVYEGKDHSSGKCCK